MRPDLATPPPGPVSPSSPVGGPVGGPVGPAQQGLDAQTPLLLLPVNIETRFMDVNDGEAELWVRIYPDQIAIDAHEPELTLQEIADGQSYWTQVWSAGNPPPTADGAQAPWRALATIYGAPRAAWIALQLTPTNPAQQPVAPAAPGAAPNPAPVFPGPPTRASSWEKPAVADALPDAWTVVLISGSQTSSQQGGPISPVLAMGLTPLTGPLPPGTSPFSPGSPVDAGLQWLVDFDVAVAAGMALKIPLTRDQRIAGFDRILVYGLRTSGVGTDDLGALLDAHHYTDGFALVPPGSPTKNTTDASSAFSRKDPDFAASFAYERQGPLTAQPGCDGDVFASLVGVDPAHLAHTQHADGVNIQSGQDMLTALWPATLGYFFSQMMDPVFQAGQIDAAREYVLANTLPRGAAPAFRVGTTPYGVLPVTSLTRYKPSRSDIRSEVIQDGLVAFVTRLWPVWLASSAGAPHMQTTGDPDAELIGLLGMDASSSTFRGREVMGSDFLWNYMTFLGFPLTAMQAWLADALSPGRLLLDAFGEGAWDPRLIHLGLSGSSFPVAYPTVQSGPLSETDPLTADADLGGGVKGNYVQWLAQASVADIQTQTYPGPTPTSLLYMILRQSLILGYGAPAAMAEIGAGRLQAAQFREAELVGIPVVTPPAHPTVGVWDLLDRPSIPNPALSWGDYLISVVAPPSSPYGQVTALRASLNRLAVLPTAELDRLLTETLDACSHRLDVWAATVANAILNRTRAANTAGVHLGAFGWLEEIRPSPQRAVVEGPELAQVRSLDALRAQRVPGAAALPTPVQPLVDNGGYIYCPSPEQAAVAAVLRNGYMTHKGTTEEPMLDIDLSSERVRYALSLLQGVQQGQSLNALLGYLFEAGLDALSLQQYTQPFRDLFPVVGSKLTPSSAPSEAVAASNVVDGLALRTAWDNGKLAAGQNWGTGLPPPGPDQAAVIGLLTTLDSYAHALGDVSMAEAVFQVIRGNFGRAGGLMDAISKGDRPPDPDVITTPRGGLDLTQRVAVLIAGVPAVATAWNAVGVHPRAAAEPWLEAWLTGLLPDPSTVTCSVQYTAGGVAQSVPVSLLQLDVGALDCLAMADAAAIPQQGELEARILYAAAVPSGATTVQINYQPAAPPTGWVSFPDFFFLAKALRTLISSARALGPQDMTVPENDVSNAGLVDSAELQARSATALARLQSDTAALSSAAGAAASAASASATAAAAASSAAASGAANAAALAAAAAAAASALTSAEAALRAALLACAYYGVTGAMPSTVTDAKLATQATSVLGVLNARIAKASAPGLAAADILSAIFGKDFVVLPRFAPPDSPDLKKAFAQSAAMVASDPAAPTSWMTQLTHVRPAILRLDSAMSLARVLGGAALDAPAPTLGQLPYVAADRWLGLPIDPANPPAKGRVALACFTLGDPAAAKYAGLLVDEWPERIPSTTETASLAFHYEEPKARAPQACLLAVCPDDRSTWDADLVTGILEETLQLAKIRTVDLSSLQEMGQILPALYFSLNLQEATVSANFAREIAVGRPPIRL
jgi:hypothetical protein